MEDIPYRVILYGKASSYSIEHARDLIEEFLQDIKTDYSLSLAITGSIIEVNNNLVIPSIDHYYLQESIKKHFSESVVDFYQKAFSEFEAEISKPNFRLTRSSYNYLREDLLNRLYKLNKGVVFQSKAQEVSNKIISDMMEIWAKESLSMK